MGGRHRSEAAPDTTGPMDAGRLAGCLAASSLEHQVAEAIRSVLACGTAA